MLALLVVISLILLTDYFGGSSTSPLHSVQRGVVEVLSPLQQGASKVLSPVRDVAGYISSVVTARSQVSELRSENYRLKQVIANGQYETKQYERQQALLKLDDADNLASDRPVTANVIGYDPSLWWYTVTLDKGSASGVRVDDPVISTGGLVGKVADVGPNYSVVELLTSPKFAVGAMVEDSGQDAGILKPAVGNPGTLVLGSLPTSAQPSTGQEVVTSGFADPGNPAVRSIFPPGILIGQISNQNPQVLLLTSQQVDVKPSVNLLHLSVAQVLTRPHG